MTSIFITDIDIIRDEVCKHINILFEAPDSCICIKTIQHPIYGQYIKNNDKISLSNEITQSIIDNINSHITNKKVFESYVQISKLSNFYAHCNRHDIRDPWYDEYFEDKITKILFKYDILDKEKYTPARIVALEIDLAEQMKKKEC